MDVDRCTSFYVLSSLVQQIMITFTLVIKFQGIILSGSVKRFTTNIPLVFRLPWCLERNEYKLKVKFGTPSYIPLEQMLFRFS